MLSVRGGWGEVECLHEVGGVGCCLYEVGGVRLSVCTRWAG